MRAFLVAAVTALALIASAQLLAAAASRRTQRSRSQPLPVLSSQRPAAHATADPVRTRAASSAPPAPTAERELEAVADAAMQLYETNDPRAERYFLEVIRRSERDNGPAHFLTLSNKLYLGRMYTNAFRLSEAEPLLRTVLEATLDTHGPRHRDALIGMRDYAQLLLSQGLSADAETLLRKAVAVAREMLPSNDPTLLNFLDPLGRSLQDQGHYAAAVEPYTEALVALRRSLGDAHPRTLTAINNLATLLSDAGDFAAAEPLLLEVIAGERPVQDTVKFNLAFLYSGQGRLEEAEPLYRESLAGLQRALGPTHPKTLRCAAGLHDLLRKKGERAQRGQGKAHE